MGVFERDADNILKVVGEWAPQPGRREADYESALYRLLHDNFPDDRFERQYARGKTGADVFVAFKDGAAVAIELKRNLCDRTEAHRLIGQVYEYLTEWRAEVIVVLCGRNDPAAVKLIRQAVGHLREVASKKAYLIEKTC